MTPTAAWVLVALAAVLVGAAVPVLLQLRRTLKAAEQTLESTGRQVNETLARVNVTLGRIDKASEQLEFGVTRVSSLFEALGGIGDSLANVRSSVSAVGSFLGGAFLGALRRTPKKSDEGGQAP